VSGRTLSDSRRRWLLGAVVLFLIAIAAIANAGQSEPARKTNTQTSQPPKNTTTRSEPGGQEGPEGLPRPSGAGGSPGAPLAVARAFAAAWINRPTSASGVARERSTLLALSRGELATRINFAFIQQARSDVQSGSRGSVLAARIVARPTGAVVELLVTTREQLTEHEAPREPPHYSLYLARLEQQGGRGYLLSDWQPQ
jgi:hypothetical protein